MILIMLLFVGSRDVKFHISYPIVTIRRISSLNKPIAIGQRTLGSARSIL
ncbi:hypothetical protein [Nostoc sp. FACHB-888]|nr:hypothetical protein [Nostoc sp. FACHB-888]MBD2245218.1 hypothetical protein [Nostoc sp. FACHB-888]